MTTKPTLRTLAAATLVAAAVAWVAAGCTTQRTASPTKAEPLPIEKEQVWQLVAVQGREMPRTGSVITLQINSEAGTASGRTACNTYSAQLRLSTPECRPEADRYTLRLGKPEHSSTRCPEADQNAEERYLGLLPRATRMDITAYTLTLYQKEREILKYELQ